MFQVFQSFLKRDNKRMEKYVSVGLTVVDSAMVPLNHLMKHLLIVQGISPETVPGERRRRELEATLMESFNKLAERDYDEDYDFGWVNSRYQITQRKLKNLNLTKDSFKKYTDLGKIQDAPKYEESPLSAAIASKYDSHTVTPPGTPSALVAEDIGSPEKQEESPLFATLDSFVNWAEEHKPDLLDATDAIGKVYRAKKSLQDFADQNPGVLEDVAKDEDSALRQSDPVLSKLEKLLSRLEENRLNPKYPGPPAQAEDLDNEESVEDTNPPSRRSFKKNNVNKSSSSKTFRRSE